VPERSRKGSDGPLVESPAVANIKSQKKRNLQNERRRVRNKSVRSALKTEAKKARAAAVGDDLEGAQAQARAAARDLDKAASQGVIHKRTAARRKSRLARELSRAASDSSA
jgi:small subunit ribosomal protein S20